MRIPRVAPSLVRCLPTVGTYVGFPGAHRQSSSNRSGRETSRRLSGEAGRGCFGAGPPLGEVRLRSTIGVMGQPIRRRVSGGSSRSEARSAHVRRNAVMATSLRGWTRIGDGLPAVPSLWLRGLVSSMIRRRAAGRHVLLVKVGLGPPTSAVVAFGSPGLVVEHAGPSGQRQRGPGTGNHLDVRPSSRTVSNGTRIRRGSPRSAPT